MFLFGGGKKSEAKKIGPEFSEQIRTALKPQLCPLCHKNIPSKVVFGEGVKPGLTCNNCELKAVGGSIQKLGDSNLIPIDKLTGLVTSELTAYQTTKSETPAEMRKCPENAAQLVKKAKESGEAIKAELQLMQERTKNKLEELTNQADKQNSVTIFEEVLKTQKEKRPLTTDQCNEMARRSLVGPNGVHFVDENAVSSSQADVDARLNTLRKETHIKLKDLSKLIDDINQMEL